jgi:hypothetical protein
VVILDDLHLLDLYSGGCHFYPRSGYFNAVIMGLCTYTLESNRKLIFSTTGHLAEPRRNNAAIPSALTASRCEDYAALMTVWLGKNAAQLDFATRFSALRPS